MLQGSSPTASFFPGGGAENGLDQAVVINEELLCGA
jgi:hypothetical protein